MGLLCTSCARKDPEADEKENPNIIKANNSINLPKQYVDVFGVTKNSEAEEPIMENKAADNMKPETNQEEPDKDHIGKKNSVEIKNEKSLGSNLNIDEIQNIINGNNNISKISSLNMDMKPNEEIEEPDAKKEEDNEKENENDNIAKKVEEVHVSKDGSPERKNIRLQTMKSPSKKDSNLYYLLISHFSIICENNFLNSVLALGFNLIKLSFIWYPLSNDNNIAPELRLNNIAPEDIDL